MNEFQDRVRDAYADLHLAVPGSTVPELARRRRRRLATLRAVIAAAAVVAGAGVALGVYASPPPVATPPAADPDPTGGLRSLRAEDLGFFDPVLPPNLCAIALWEPLPRDLAEGVETSTTVVLAEMVDVRTRTLVDGDGNDQGAMLGVVLRAIEVLHGDLTAGGDEIVVEFGGGKDSDEAVAAMRSSLPAGLAVWFLREADTIGPPPGGDPVAVPVGHYYQVLHSLAGVLVQGPDHVVAGPLRCPATPGQPRESAPPGDMSLTTDAERFATLDDLLGYLRTLT